MHGLKADKNVNSINYIFLLLFIHNSNSLSPSRTVKSQLWREADISIIAFPSPTTITTPLVLRAGLTYLVWAEPWHHMSATSQYFMVVAVCERYLHDLTWMAIITPADTSHHDFWVQRYRSRLSEILKLKSDEKLKISHVLFLSALRAHLQLVGGVELSSLPSTPKRELFTLPKY
jgi:hypothetical protein